jgi:hypothetical protein
MRIDADADPRQIHMDSVHYVSVQTAQIGKDVPVPMCSATAHQKNAELNVHKAIPAYLHARISQEWPESRDTIDENTGETRGLLRPGKVGGYNVIGKRVGHVSESATRSRHILEF